MNQIEFTRTKKALSMVYRVETDIQARPICETCAIDLKRASEEVAARKWKHQQEETRKLINQAIISEFASALASN